MQENVIKSHNVAFCKSPARIAQGGVDVYYMTARDVMINDRRKPIDHPKAVTALKLFINLNAPQLTGCQPTGNRMQRTIGHHTVEQV